MLPLFVPLSTAASRCSARLSRLPRVLGLAAVLAALGSLTGCDQINKKLGIEDPAKKQAQQEAEGKAVGQGCRHSGRAIEDCYSIYNWLPKDAIFGGWKEMDTYMRENSIETIAPQLPPAPPPPPPEPKKKKAKPPAEEKTDDEDDDEKEKDAEKSDKSDKADKPDKADKSSSKH